MDDLSTLVEDSIAESEVSQLPKADFTASLDYIDSLASRSSVSLSRRDVADITTAASTFDYLSPLINSKAVPGPTERSFQFQSDMRPLQDARMFDPERSSRPATALNRSASRIVSPLNRFPPGWRNPLDPTRDPNEIERSLNSYYKRATTPIWNRQFSKPNQVVICLKRKIRRNVMHAFGFAGLSGFKPPVRTYYSRIIC